VVVLLLAAGLSGCLVSSFQPIYDDTSIVFDDQLLGTWENRELQVSATVTRGQWRSYTIAFTDRTGPARFTAFLTGIAGQRFLDVRPIDGRERPAYLIASNGILQVAMEAQQLRVRELDYEVVTSRLKAGTLKIPAVTDLQQNVVFAADTAAIRAWLATAVRDETLFADWKTLSRR
jgi:hypothetical protein